MRAIGLCKACSAQLGIIGATRLPLRTSVNQLQQQRATACLWPRALTQPSRRLHIGGIRRSSEASQQETVVSDGSPQSVVEAPPRRRDPSKRANDSTQKPQKPSSKTRSRQVDKRGERTRAELVRSYPTYDERETHWQWGFLRHQSSGKELDQVRRCLNRWKKHYPRVRSRPLPKWPWLRKAAWLWECESVDAMRAAWHKLDEDTRALEWPTTMLSTMASNPEMANAVLRATMDPPPPGYALNDVLLFIAANVLPDLPPFARKRTSQVEDLMDLLRFLIIDHPESRIPFAQRLWGMLSKKLPSDQVVELQALLEKANIRLHANTQIHFAHKLAGDPAHKTAAFEILQSLSDKGLDLNEARPSSVVTSLLHNKVAGGADGQPVNNSFSVTDAVQFLTEKGFMLNLVSATALLDTLCQRGEVEEAIRLALLFSESGIKLDTKLWATVWRGAKSSLRAEVVAKAVDVAKAANVSLIDVLNNALHAVFYFSEMERREKKHQTSNRQTLFDPLLRVYARRFDLAPLQWWLPDALPTETAQDAGINLQSTTTDHIAPTGWTYESTIVPFVNELFSAGDGSKLTPTPATITTMLRAYVRSIQRPFDLVSYYQFFKSRLEEQAQGAERIPPAERLIHTQGSLIHDTIILAMTDHKDLTRPALEVFGDMLRDQLRSNDKAVASKRTQDNETAPPASKSTEGDHSAPLDAVHPPPSVLTFTVLLRGLMSDSSRILVEQIMQVMRELGVEPSLATWNTIVRGHAVAQDVARTVSALQDMDAAGHRPDVYTFRAFGKLRNQARALEVMEGLIDATQRRVKS